MCSLNKSAVPPPLQKNMDLTPALTKDDVTHHATSRPPNIAPYTTRVISSQPPTSFQYVWNHKAEYRTVFNHGCIRDLHSAYMSTQVCIYCVCKYVCVCVCGVCVSVCECVCVCVVCVCVCECVCV